MIVMNVMEKEANFDPDYMQKCYRCRGEGKIYTFENKSRIGKHCIACKGFQYIDYTY